MKFRDFIRIREAYGFVLDRQRGSHRAYKGFGGWQGASSYRRLPSRERRYQARHIVLNDPAVGTAQTHIQGMGASGSQRHGKLMSLSVAVTA